MKLTLLSKNSAKFLLGGMLAFLSQQNFAQGTFAPLTGINPNGGTAITLSDGSIVIKTEAGGGDGIGNIWDKLTPNANGNYMTGTWSQLPPMASTRLYISSQLLKRWSLIH